MRIVNPTSSTYDSRSLVLNVTFTYGGLRYNLTYTLDGQNGGAIPMGEYRPPNNELHMINTAYAWVDLPELSDGPHSVTVTLVASVHYSGGGKPGAPFQPTSPNSSEYSATWTDTVHFNINSDEPFAVQPEPERDSTPPEILVLTLDNNTYSSPDVPLNFSINGNASSITYSLDGNDNVTIAGNVTLNGLVAGVHNITVYCWDVAGNVGTSKTIHFQVNEVNSESIEQPVISLTTVIVFVSVTFLVVVTSVVCLKKRKRDCY